jgi:hypothetical protein
VRKLGGRAPFLGQYWLVVLPVRFALRISSAVSCKADPWRCQRRRGWTPRIQTYPGREVPNPLIIDINRGEADINVVLKDILSLTKLNYNTCIFGDRMPITLKFADAVGEILTAGPIKDVPPLPFAHYI